MANAAEKNSADTQRDLAAAMSTLASRPAPTGKRPLTGRERAAVLMLALGEQYGAKIWGMLDDDELRELSVAMSAIGAIEADVVENLLLEFVTRMSASGALMGSYEATERLLQQYLPPERVGAIMEQPRAKRSTTSRAPTVLPAGWLCSANPISRPATAGSNGPTAASIVTPAPPTASSAKRSRATSLHAAVSPKRAEAMRRNGNE